jgi:hypothetical protein
LFVFREQNMSKTLHILCLLAAVICACEAFAQRPAGGAGRDLRAADKLAVGDPAPDFKLKTLDGSCEVQLSACRGKRPVVLIFGSYT